MSLARKIRAEEAHIRALRRIVGDPSTLDSEVERHRRCIIEHLDAVKQHQQRIRDLSLLADTAAEKLTVAVSSLQALKRQASRQTTEELLAKYLELQNTLDELGA